MRETLDDNFPANYDQLNWCIKNDILDQLELLSWQLHSWPKIIPSKQEAEAIGLREGWRDYLDGAPKQSIGELAFGIADSALKARSL